MPSIPIRKEEGGDDLDAEEVGTESPRKSPVIPSETRVSWEVGGNE